MSVTGQPTPASPAPPLRARIVLFLLLSAATGLSQFYRVSNSVIGPEIAAELSLSALQLGLAGGAFFLALLVAQIPVGMAFDRWGARATLASISGLAVLGALWIAAARNPAELIAARFVVGLGCAANFMAAVYLCSRWYGADRFTLALSWVFAASNLGTLAAATPLAWAAQHWGWRRAFVALALATVAMALLFWWRVRDDPPGAPPPAHRRESLAEIWRGLLEVWRTPGLGPVFSMHVFAYACMVTVLGVWAGPYLNDVHGLDGVARGNVLLGMGVAQIVGLLVFGPLDRILGTRKRIVVAGASLSIVVFATLALLERPPLALAVALLAAIPFLSSYSIVIVAQGRALFPAHLAGRGVTTVNMAQVLGATGLPALSGWIVGAMSAPAGGAAPEAAYRAVFAALAAGSLLGLSIYLRSKDSRPAA
ncbi:MAG: MFS transporter [Betaproteobacteria bacterium]|nr:MFS transporter [Betaproteobacteria bacterium]